MQSKTYGIQDILKYDDCSSDKLSNYTITGTVTYDSTNQCYSVSNNNLAEIIQPISYSEDWECSVDLKYLQAVNGQYFYYGVENDNRSYQLQTQMIRQLNRLYIWENGASSSYGTISPSMTTGKWYTLKLTKSGSTITEKLYDGSTEVGSFSTTCTGGTHTNLRFYLDKGQVAIKNIKVKAL